MGRTLRVAALAVIAALMLASNASMAEATSDQARAATAIGYLATQQMPDGSIPAFSPIGSTSDAVLAIVAAGTGRSTMLAALGYLSSQISLGNVNTIGLQAKVAMAVEATGRNARKFGGQNLIHEIRTTLTSSGRFGTASVLDQSLAILAFEGAGSVPPASAVTWLKAAQCPDGGWQFDEPYDPSGEDIHCLSIASAATDYFESDTNTTAYAVQALEAAGAAPFPHSPFVFFDALRDATHGGWSYTWGYTTTDANSTALVTQAFLAAGKRAPGGAIAALRALQYACGAFAYSWSGTALTGPDLGATIGAVPALQRRSFPYKGKVAGNAPVTPAC